MGKKFKILSIDGGGIRGIIPAKVLCDLEEHVQKKDGPQARLCDYFDLICGTSTGGIIAIGLAIGMSAKDVLTLYEENASQIFPKSNKRISKLLANGGVFYQRDVLKTKLTEAYEQAAERENPRIYHCKTRICVPMYDLKLGAFHVLKTDHHKEYHRDLHIPLVDAALATAAAPIYFTPHNFEYTTINGNNVHKCIHYIDGGIAANNPVMIGFTEAHYTLNIPLEDIEILSIGTGERVLTSQECDNSRQKGATYWLWPFSKDGLRIYELMSSAQSLYIHNTMSLIANGTGQNQKQFNYLRIQHKLDCSLALDTSDKHLLDSLHTIGQELYKNHGTQINKFVEEKVEQYKHYNTL